MVHVTPAGVQHKKVLASMGKQTFIDAFGVDNNPADLDAYVSQAFSEDTVRRELLDPNSAVYIAYQKGEPIGYLKLRQGVAPQALQDSRALELQRIYVQQRALGQGIGARLMQTAIDHANRGGYRILWLGVWERNPLAINFYQRWGFTKFGTHIFTIGQDAQTDWLMQKLLIDQS
jgi:GNAT superfamily N-acetyltransferase